MKYKIGELFCGPGGIAAGAELASDALLVKNINGYEHAWAVDYHQDSCQTYINNIPGASSKTVLCKDVRSLDPEKDLKPISDIDIFAYGFPCNDFSLVGEHLGLKGDFGPLYTYGLPILDLFKPKAFIAENVGGIRSADEGKTFKKILLDLANCGYRIIPHLYKFEQYDVPQKRHRVIMVGIRHDLGVQYKVPKPMRLARYITCKHAIESPPISDDCTNHDLTRQSKVVANRLSFIKEGENAWNADIPEELRLNVRGAKLSQIYKRLDSKQPAYTITGSGGGGTHVYHWKENRALTNRERARLQTFPDKFNFIGGKESVRRQIGMAVPPIGIRYILEAISKTLSGEPYEFIESNMQ